MNLSQGTACGPGEARRFIRWLKHVKIRRKKEAITIQLFTLFFTTHCFQIAKKQDRQPDFRLPVLYI